MSEFLKEAAFPEFCAALLAGGKSSRMGRDKARLPAADGRALWEAQLEKLRSLEPQEILLSCRFGQDFAAGKNVRIVPDAWPGTGPLGGIVSCLEAMPAEADSLLVLAVDLPGMTPEVLRELLEICREAGSGQGAVFVRDGFFEPLAAVYPRGMTAEGRRRLEKGENALQPWLRQAAERGFMRTRPLRAEHAAAFLNVNTPEDFARWKNSAGF